MYFDVAVSFNRRIFNELLDMIDISDSQQPKTCLQ